MTSADIPFDNTYADRQINHHQRMLKQFQMGTKPRVEHSFSASLSDPSIPVDGCSSLLPDSPTSGDSYSLPSPPPLLINLADPYLAPQKAQQVVLPFTCLDKGVYGSLVHPSPVNSTWLSQPYYGNVQQLANSSQGLGLDSDSIQQPCDQTLGFSFNADNCGNSANYIGQPFSMPYSALAINSNYILMSQAENKNVAPDNLEYPQSPLCSISGSTSPTSENNGGEGLSQLRLRRTSDRSLARSSKSGKRGHKRRTTWSEGMADEGPNVSREQKEQELAQLERTENEADPDERHVRRRLQNRLAQRAFRARYKVNNREAQSHLNELEDLVEAQNAQIQSLSAALDGLQWENSTLKAGR